VEHSRGPREESTQFIFDKGAEYTMEKTQPLQQMLLGKVVICLQKTETRSMPVTLYKYQLKVD
jgi:hypothetical protein